VATIIYMQRRHICSRCGWANTRPSERRGLVDGFFSIFWLMPVRCRNCRNRFYRLRSGWPKYAISTALVVLLALSAVIVLRVREGAMDARRSAPAVSSQGDADRQQGGR